MTAARQRLETALARHPKVAIAHLPTPVEPLRRLGDDHGLDLWVKRDDCTGIGLGGNKARQLEYHFGAALREDADTVLITGAVQSNYARTTAAMAARLGMDCHIQLEDRVAGGDALYHSSGNVLLDRLFGATMHHYPEGEDEAGADRALQDLAERLRGQGRRPHVIPLGPGHAPLGALGYAGCALELERQLRGTESEPRQIVVASGSAHTHAGLLVGLRALGWTVPVLGICVRRPAAAQGERVAARCREIVQLLDLPVEVGAGDIAVDDAALAPGYGRVGPQTRAAVLQTARREGLLLDPVYTGKTMAGLIAAHRAGRLAGEPVLLIHTGGQPALFAYGEALLAGED